MIDVSVLMTSVGNDGFPDVYKALKNNPDNCNINVVGLDVRENAPGLYLADTGIIVSERDDNNHVHEINKIIEDNNIDLMFPLSTLDQEFYAARRKLFNVPVLASGYDSLKIANDKFVLMNYLINNGLGQFVPKFQQVSSPQGIKTIAEKFGYPQKKLVYKLNKSTGAKGLKIIDSEIKGIDRLLDRDNKVIRLNELLGWAGEIEEWPASHMVEYLPGAEYSVDVLADNENILSIVIRERTETIYGLSKVAEVVREPDIEEAVKKIVSKLKLEYVFNIQFKKDEKSNPKILEINPRIPGTIGLTVQANVNMPYYAVKLALGEKFKMPGVQVGKKILRIWSGVYLD